MVVKSEFRRVYSRFCGYAAEESCRVAVQRIERCCGTGCSLLSQFEARDECLS